MSARFVKFALDSGKPVAVNPDRVGVVRRWSDTECQIYIDDGTSEGDCVFVKGTLDEVMALFSGDQPAPAPLKAHLYAVGWVQNPELPK